MSSDKPALAHALAEANSVPRVRDVLAAAIVSDEQAPSAEANRILDELEGVVASALFVRGESSRHWGAYLARESVAHRLGLGDLVRPTNIYPPASRLRVPEPESEQEA